MEYERINVCRNCREPLPTGQGRGKQIWCSGCRKHVRRAQYHKDARCKKQRNTYFRKIGVLSCTEKDCSRPRYCKGICKIHYDRIRIRPEKTCTRCGTKKPRGEFVLSGTVCNECRKSATCKVPGCENRIYGEDGCVTGGFGYCKPHYNRYHRGANLDGEFKRAKNHGSVDSNGYIARRVYIDGKYTVMQEHRLIMMFLLGRELEMGEEVHHINGIRDDNRPENLELWSNSHPSGQKALDKVRWARHIIELYGDYEERVAQNNA